MSAPHTPAPHMPAPSQTPPAADAATPAEAGSVAVHATRPDAAALPRAAMWYGISAAATTLLAASLMLGLVILGLYGTPTLGVAAYAAESAPRRPPIVPPMVPEGAREDWAVWSYVDKINQAWGKDWPLVIQWFEELDARYPGNPMVLDKLYVSYLEDARRLLAEGDVDGARTRYDQAARFDPERGVAQQLLDELDSQIEDGQ
ncbi:MAG: hypothetical protein IT306_07285 [Chloroflexi bacterium]|nr:hypothetical protein [Chloroflexota bacterium]